MLYVRELASLRISIISTFHIRHILCCIDTPDELQCTITERIMPVLLCWVYGDGVLIYHSTMHVWWYKKCYYWYMVDYTSVHAYQQIMGSLSKKESLKKKRKLMDTVKKKILLNIYFLHCVCVHKLSAYTVCTLRWVIYQYFILWQIYGTKLSIINIHRPVVLYL